ncbi:MAG: pentapeptide repeat-containing protein [Gammaproteobacteria bacterium]
MNNNQETWQKIAPFVWGTAQSVSWALLIFLAVIFVSVMWSDSFAKSVAELLGTDSGHVDGIGKRDTLEFIGLVMGGLLAAIGAIAINRRAEAEVQSAAAQSESARAQQATADAQIQSNKFAERRYVDEKYESAIRHLGHASDDMRVAAYYSLYRLAQIYEELRETIFTQLCAQLRQITTASNYKGKDRGNPTEGVQTLLDLLFKSQSEEYIFSEFAVDLRSAVLNGANLKCAHMRGAQFGSEIHGVDFTGANLQKTDFRKINLTTVIFNFACLQQANMEDVFLRGTNIIKVQLQGARLFAADLTDAVMHNAQMQGADLRTAKMRGIKLNRARLQMANLERADLTSANLTMAKLHGADLAGTRLSGAILPGAEFQGATICDADWGGVFLIAISENGKKEILENSIFFGEISEKEAENVEEVLVRYSEERVAQKYREIVRSHKGKKSVHGLSEETSEYKEIMKK